MKELQQALIDSGYLDDKADGIFGSRTEAAVMAWQADKGLEQTGIVTPEQLEKILSEPARPAASAAVTVEPSATAKPSAMATAKPTPTPTAEPTATPTPTPTPIPTPSPTPDISKIPGTVALVRVESKLNLREQPSVKSAVLAEIPGGAAVQVLQSGAVWSKIAYEDQTGWVGSKFLEIVRN